MTTHHCSCVLALAALMLTQAAAAADAPAKIAASRPAMPAKALFDTDDTTIIKRSRNDICYDNSSARFAQTEHYTAFRTIKDCIDSGGRLPK